MATLEGCLHELMTNPRIADWLEVARRTVQDDEARASLRERPRVVISANQPLEVELSWAGGSELLRVGDAP